MYKQYASDALENGSGMGIMLGLVDDNGNRSGGHSITIWGYLCDAVGQLGYNVSAGR